MKKCIISAYSILLIYFSVNVVSAGEKVYFYYADPAGTPLAISDATGSVVWRASYLPFGEETINLATVQNNKMFVGKEKDSESGLYYFSARYMDPTAGRFTSPDIAEPINITTGKINDKFLTNLQRLNKYAYAGNNPYAYFDPQGLDWYYSQSTGRLVYFSMSSQLYVDFGNVGNSGHGTGMNNSKMQGFANTGPIVAGTYTIGYGEDYQIQTGKLKGTVLTMAMQLSPDDATAASIKSLKRGPDSFLIHRSLRKDGGTAGCIGMSDEMRNTMNEIMWDTGDTTLHVESSLLEDSSKASTASAGSNPGSPNAD